MMHSLDTPESRLHNSATTHQRGCCASCSTDTYLTWSQQCPPWTTGREIRWTMPRQGRILVVICLNVSASHTGHFTSRCSDMPNMLARLVEKHHLRRKILGTGRNFTRQVSKSNTSLYRSLVCWKEEGVTNLALWFLKHFIT